ncbi:MAG: DUF2723 domain-containing protein [Chloroflexi bacterium]|nr:DUF2723 domain-containing protein [Chloroflexota bacterium]
MNSRLTIGLVVFITALTFYVATLAPTVEWGDFGGFQTRVSIGELELAPYGHPLWNLIARPFTWLPFGDSAFRVNLSSAFFASLTLLVLWFTLPALTQSRTASILAILALAISHTFWTYSVLPKAYTLTLFILALGLLLLLRWRESPRAWPIVAVGVLLGLGIMNHLVVATAVPGYTVFVLWHSRRRLGDMLRFAVGVAGGLAPYFYLLSTTPTKGSDTLTSVMSYVTKFAQLLATPPELLTGIAFTAANVAYQFLLLTPVALWGWWRMWRDDRSLAAALMMIFAGDVAFVLVPVAPPIMQNWHLFHPAHLALTYPLAYGLAAIAERLRYSRRSAAAQITTGLAAIVVPALLTYFILAPEAARAFHITDRVIPSASCSFPPRQAIIARAVTLKLRSVLCPIGRCFSPTGRRTRPSGIYRLWKVGGLM